jgi:hypothetical protein
MEKLEAEPKPLLPLPQASNIAASCSTANNAGPAAAAAASAAVPETAIASADSVTTLSSNRKLALIM